MEVNVVAFFSFALITTFTPGPNNISSASMGILVGYKDTLKYLTGITTGFFLVMLSCALVSAVLLQAMPRFEPILRVVGVIYILWLAYHTLWASYTFQESDQPPMGFKNGLLLQVVNPKVIIYGLAIYSTFLAALEKKAVPLILSAMLLAGIAFCATSAWTLFGATIRRYLHRPRVRLAVNVGLALLLVFTAVELLELDLF